MSPDIGRGRLRQIRVVRKFYFTDYLLSSLDRLALHARCDDRLDPATKARYYKKFGDLVITLNRAQTWSVPRLPGHL